MHPENALPAARIMSLGRTESSWLDRPPPARCWLCLHAALPVKRSSDLGPPEGRLAEAAVGGCAGQILHFPWDEKAAR